MDANLFYFEQLLYYCFAYSCETTDLKRPAWNFSWQFCFQGESKQVNRRETCACGVCMYAFNFIKTGRGV